MQSKITSTRPGRTDKPLASFVLQQPGAPQAIVWARCSVCGWEIPFHDAIIVLGDVYCCAGCRRTGVRKASRRIDEILDRKWELDNPMLSYLRHRGREIRKTGHRIMNPRKRPEGFNVRESMEWNVFRPELNPPDKSNGV